MDEGESPEKAAIRELFEETGYTATQVIESSPILVNDPGIIHGSTSNTARLIIPRYDQCKYEAHSAGCHHGGCAGKPRPTFGCGRTYCETGCQASKAGRRA